MTQADFYVRSVGGRTSEDRIVRRVRALERRVTSSVRRPQLPNSAVDDGAITITSGGVVTGIVGQQYDGTSGYVPVNGPTPPTPLPPSAVTVVGGIKVTVTGGLVDPQSGYASPVVLPLDFVRWDVEVDDNAAFTNFASSAVGSSGSILPGTGGSVTVAWPVAATPLYVRVRTRSGTGKRSAPSDVFGPIVSGAIGLGDLGFDLANYVSSNSITYGTVAPSTPAIGALWVKEVSSGPPPKYETWRWTGAAWVILQDQGVTNALLAASTAQTAADTKAKIFTQATTPAYSGAANTAYWVDTSAAGGNVSKVWSGSAWTTYKIGNGAIQANSLVASNVIATGTVTAALLESIMVLTTRVLAGPANAAHAEMSGSGFQTFDVDPDGFVTSTGGLGTGDDGLTLIDPATGATMVSMDRGGAIASRELSVSGTDSSGNGTVDGGFNVYGQEFGAWMDGKAAGTIASAFFSNAASGLFASGITTRFGLGEVSLVQATGRQYMVVFSGLHFASTVAGDRGLLSVRFTTDGSTPTISNGTPLASSFFHLPVANAAYSCPPIIGMGSFPAGSTVRLLVCLERFTGTGSLSAYTYTSPTDPYTNPFRFFVIEMGRDIPDTYIPNDGGGVRAGGSPSATGKQTYTSTWAPSFIGSYLGNGSRRTDTTDMVEGYIAAYSAGGNQKALAGFTGNAISGETTKTITAALSGATVSKVEIYIYLYHSYSNAGGNSSIGYHGNTTLPATAPAATYGGFSNAYFTNPSGRWMTLPSSTHANWANGTYRGFTVGPTGDYMRFYGGGSLGPRMRITYTR